MWDYPRPPRVEPTTQLVRVLLGGKLIAQTKAAYRVLETSHPPTYYLPPDAFEAGSLRPAAGGSFCEWKGTASYLDLVGAERTAARAAWTYSRPTQPFAVIAGHVALYPGLVDECTVDGEVVLPQPGGFYGGWVTSAVCGPFKGEPGTSHW